MFKKIFSHIFLLSFILFLFYSDISCALISNSLDSIKKEFKTIPASIKKIENKEIIIDKGEEDGIKKGDYFQIVKRGDAAIDPDTREIIGYLKTKQAIIQVKKLSKDNASCEIVSGEGPFYAGQQLIRFSGIDAVFIGDDEVSKDIVSVLVELNWVPAGYNSLLKFVQKGNKLEVFDNNSNKLRDFEIKSIGTKKETLPKTADNKKSINVERLNKDINHAVFAKIPIDVIQFELDKSGEKMFFLTTDGFFVTPYKKKGESELIYSIGGIYRPVSFSVSQDERYISLNLIIPEVGYKAIIFENTKKPKKLRKDINMYLSFEGGLLYGQGLEKDRMPSQKVFGMDINGQEINYLSEEIYPEYFDLKNSCFRDLNRDGNFEIIFFHDKKIFINENDNKLNIFELPLRNNSVNNPSAFYCMKDLSENKVLLSVNKELITIEKEDSGFALKAITILKDNESFTGIYKMGDYIIIGVKALSEDTVITTLRSFPVKEIF